MSPALEQASRNLSSLSTDLQRIGGQMQTAGMILTTAVTLPLIAIGGTAVKAFADFDKAMTESTAIMGDLSATMREQLSDAAREVARVTTFSATEAAEAYFFLASAGLDAAQSLEALPRVAQFAQAGNFNMALATDLLTDAQSALGLTIRDDVVANMENMVRVSDALVGANILANASVQQFSESLTTKAGAALRSVNKDVEEGLAVLAAFADQGIKGAEAGTQFAIVMRDLQSKAIDNKREFEQLGVSVFDANGKMQNLADIIGDLEGLLQNMTDEGKKATLMQLGFADRSVSAMMALLGTSDAIREYERRLRDMAGITEEVSQKQLKTFWEQLGLLGSRLKDLGIELGGGLVPMMEKLTGAAGKALVPVEALAKGFGDLPVPLQLTIVGVTGLFAALGPLLLVFGTFATGAASFITLLTTLVPGLTAAGVASSAAGIAVAAFTAALAVVVVPFAIYELVQLFTQLRGLSQDSAGWMRGVAAENHSHMLALAEATKVAGREITNLEEAMGILRQRAQELRFENGANAGQLKLTADQFANVRAAIGAAADGVAVAKPAFTGFTEQLEATQREVSRLTGAQREQIDAGLRLGIGVDEIADKVGVSETAVRAYSSSHKEATKAVDEHAAAIRSLAEQWSGAGALQSLANMHEAIARIGGTSVMSAQQIGQWQAAVVEGVEAMTRNVALSADAVRRYGQDTVEYWRVVANTVRSDEMLQDMRNYIGESVSLFKSQTTTLQGLTADGLIPAIAQTDDFKRALMNATPAMLRVTDNTEELRAAIERLKAEEHARKIQMLVGAFDDLGHMIGGALGQVVSQVGGVIGALDAMHHRMETGSGVVEGWANRVTAAVQGAVSVWSATDPAQGGGALSGALAGMQAGAAFGPYGAAIGAGAGALIGWARSTGPDADELSAREAVAALHADIMENAKLFLTLEHVLEAGGEKWKLVNISVREAYLAMGLTVEQAYRDLDRVNNASHYSAEEVERAAASIRAAFEGVGQAYQDWFEGVEQFNTGFELRVDGFKQHVEHVKGLMTDAQTEAADAIAAQRELIQQLEVDAVAGRISVADVTAAQADLAAMIMEASDLAKNGSIEYRAELKLLQEEFQIVELYAVTAFSQTLQATGSLPAAIGTVRDELRYLRDVAEEFGWESSAAIDELLRISDTIEGNRDVFTSLDAIRLMVDAVGDAGLLTKEKFDLFGRDAVLAFDTLRLRGIEADEALLLMQPTLQALWEAQERLGIEADGATGELLRQAEEVGLVGPEQKGVMEQLVGVMEDLRDVLRDEIPEALERFRQVGRSAAEDVEGAINDITGAAGNAAVAMSLIRAPSGPNAGNYDNLRDMYPFLSPAQQAGVDQILAEQGYSLFHEGGYIPRAHSGMFLGKRLAHDEVPIIAQTGESVLNRAATAAIGGEAGVNALNRGSGVGGGGVTIEVHVHGNVLGNSREFEATVCRAVNRGLQREGEAWGEHERIVKQMVRA